MNKIKKTTFADRIRNAWRAFCGKPAGSISLGLEIKKCYECEHRKQEWISVKEGLPERRTNVLCYYQYEPESPNVICENTYYGRKHGGGLWLSDGSKVTHWMPLPEPPKGGE